MPDFRVGATLDCDFDTVAAGAMTTLAGTPSLAVYKGNGTTESTAGVTLSVDFDGKTGSHHVRIDTTADAGFYATASAFTVRIAAGTVNGVSVVGRCVYAFTLEAQTVFSVYTSLQALITTVGVAGAGLTATATAVWSVAVRILTAATNITSTGGTTVPQTGDSYARLGAPAGASVSVDIGNLPTNAELSSAHTILATAVVAGVWISGTRTLTSISGLGIALASKLTKYVQLLARKDAAIATDNAAEVTELNANGGSGAGAFANTTDSTEAIRDRGDAAWADSGTPPTAAAIADQVWEEAIADHSGTAGSTAEALGAAGSAGDPWVTTLPGAYGAGSAGKILGDNLNATVSSRATPAQVNTEADTAIADAALATAAALAVVDGIVDDILLDTAEIGAAGAGLTAINLPNQTMDIVGNITGNLSGSVGSVTGAVGSVTGLTAATVHADLDDLQARLPAALTADGNIKADTLRVGGTLQTAGDIIGDTNDLQTRLPAALVSGRMDASVGAMAADVVTASAIATDAFGALELAAGAASEIASAVRTELTTELGRVDAAVSTRASQTSVDDLPTNAELASALAAADDAVLAAIAALNNLSQANVRTALGLASANLDTQLDALPTNAELATALGTADDAILAAIGMSSANFDTQLAALFTTALTESYAADGAAPSVAQALFLIQQRLTEFAIVSTALTIKKLDGSTTAGVLTLDSATAPTSSTRTT